MELELLGALAPELSRPPVLTLRDYQLTALRALFDYYIKEGKNGHPLIAMPTGTGKSLVIASIIQAAINGLPECNLRPLPGTRFLVLTHSKELVKNDYETFCRVMPDADHGVFCAELGRKDTGRQFTFASIQSVARKVEAFVDYANPIKVVVVDEAHMVSPKDGSNYLRVIDALQEAWPALTVIGLTATYWRLKDGSMVEQAGGLFTDVAVDMCSGENFLWFIQQGYLVPLVPRKPETEIDISGVGTQAGDFKDDDITAAVDAQGVIPRALQEAVKLAYGRKRWLIFAPSIRHTEEIADWLNAHTDVTATCVHSNLDGKERDRRLAAHKGGAIKAIVNKDILTTGYDDPLIDCIIVLRPTISSALWVQMLGRGTRPYFPPKWPQATAVDRLTAVSHYKPNTLVLDFAGNTERLGPINYPKIPEKPDRKKRKNRDAAEPAAKTCAICQTMTYPQALKCDVCGAPFPRPEIDAVPFASTEELVAVRNPRMPPEERVYIDVVIDRMTAEPHQGFKGKSLLVKYFSKYRKEYFRKYLPLEHPRAEYICRDWWKDHCPGVRMPSTVALAMMLSGQLRKPQAIKVWINKPGKYPKEVVDYDFGTGFAADLALIEDE